MAPSSSANLRSLTAETTGKLDVLLYIILVTEREICLWGNTNRLDSNALGVDGTKVGILKEGDEVGFDGLLKSTDSR